MAAGHRGFAARSVLDGGEHGGRLEASGRLSATMVPAAGGVASWPDLLV
jgi:hypothetical protein